ncbi:MAG: hypothetical protein NPIRA01_37440 [Nitrospirales bacterium]|nr:MAG: hypothetical protein NPIRA01_37440 [Nitrospirales bacterium]
MIALTIFLLIFLCTQIAPSIAQTSKAEEPDRPGIRPSNDRDCPPTHPIKGNFTTYNGERCIYHMKDQRYYLKTKPEHCYATASEAVLDGCRASKI